MCHSNDYQHLQPTTPSKPTRIVVSGHHDAPVPLARVVSSHVDERGLTIVVEPRDAEAAAIIRDYRVDVGSWPPMPFDWQEMAATAGWEPAHRKKPSRLERLRRAFRMQP